jgi:hypothetical protein
MAADGTIYPSVYVRVRNRIAGILSPTRSAATKRRSTVARSLSSSAVARLDVDVSFARSVLTCSGGDELRRPVTELQMVATSGSTGRRHVVIALTVAGCPLRDNFKQVAEALALQAWNELRSSST